MGDACFLNRFRGLDLVEANEQGISPSSFYRDSTGGNVFHAIVFLVGIVLNMAGRWQRGFTLFTVGYLAGGLSCFFLASGMMTYFPQYYSCSGLGLFSFVGAGLVGLYVKQVLGEEKVFELLGTMLGFIIGSLVYRTVGRAADTGTTMLGNDIVEIVFVLGGGAAGFVLVGKLEYVRRNVLMLYSALAGAIMVVMAIDYHAVARMGTGGFQPANTGVEGTVVDDLGIDSDLGFRIIVEGLVAAALFVFGYWFQRKKLDQALVMLGLADVATIEAMKAKEAAALASSSAAGGASKPGLPPGWDSTTDPNSGKTYWFNRSTGETRWTAPTQGPSAAPPPPTPPVPGRSGGAPARAPAVGGRAPPPQAHRAPAPGAHRPPPPRPAARP
eukprot:COSAG02_NODE_422_length_22587_cov_10.209089_20_plen_385_part_00